MVRSLKNLKAEDVQRNLTIFKQLINELDPTLTVERGPFHDLVLYYSAVFATANQQDISNLFKAINLRHLVDNPEAVSKEHMDRVLSNWFIRRREGNFASGIVTLISAKQTGYIVPLGTAFTANGLTFRVNESYQVRTSGTNLEKNDRKLMRLSHSLWNCSIPVTAINIGAAGNLRQGTQLSFNKLDLPHVNVAAATNDFTGGEDEETNTQMINDFANRINGILVED